MIRYHLGVVGAEGGDQVLRVKGSGKTDLAGFLLKADSIKIETEAQVRPGGTEASEEPF